MKLVSNSPKKMEFPQNHTKKLLQHNGIYWHICDIFNLNEVVQKLLQNFATQNFPTIKLLPWCTKRFNEELEPLVNPWLHKSKAIVLIQRNLHKSRKGFYFCKIFCSFREISYNFVMSIKTNRLKESILLLANEVILDFTREYEHNHGIIALLDVNISSDKSYADLIVSGQWDHKMLAKFLAPIAPRIHTKISKELGLRKTPKIRFRTPKHQENKKDVLTLIRELDEQYGLSKL